MMDRKSNRQFHLRDRERDLTRRKLALAHGSTMRIRDFLKLGLQMIERAFQSVDQREVFHTLYFGVLFDHSDIIILRLAL